jgi:hypothetical protein
MRGKKDRLQNIKVQTPAIHDNQQRTRTGEVEYQSHDVPVEHEIVVAESGGEVGSVMKE